MKRILFSLLAIAAILFSSPAEAQKTKSQLNSEILANLPDNTTGLITPAIMRTTLNDMVLSWTDWLTCSGTGGLVFWNANTPTCLNVGSTGQLLTVSAGAPAWANISSSLTAGTGIALTGTTNVTVALAGSPTLTIKSNTTGITAAPTDNTISQVMDAMIGSSRGTIAVRGASTWGALPLGSTGQQLVSNGTDLTYSTGTAAKSNVQTFTSSGTWTKPGGFGATANTHIQCWGGGGSGAKTGGGVTAGGGGGGGSYLELWLPLSSLPATVTVTIGTGGASQTAGSGAGNAGGNTTFGTILTAYGGGGGAIQFTSGSASGGAGGGLFSAGANGVAGGGQALPGSPTILTSTSSGLFIGGGDDGTNTAPPGINHGGGGGGGTVSTNFSSGRNSVWGGAGGGGLAGTAGFGVGGTSLYGGNGGLASALSPGSGLQPGGGGGSSGTANSGPGGAGECIATTYDGT